MNKRESRFLKIISNTNSLLILATDIIAELNPDQPELEDLRNATLINLENIDRVKVK